MYFEKLYIVLQMFNRKISAAMSKNAIFLEVIEVEINYLDEQIKTDSSLLSLCMGEKNSVYRLFLIEKLCKISILQDLKKVLQENGDVLFYLSERLYSTQLEPVVLSEVLKKNYLTYYFFLFSTFS